MWYDWSSSISQERVIMMCSLCGIDLYGWLYYESSSGFRICMFCYKGLVLRGDKND